MTGFIIGSWEKARPTSRASCDKKKKGSRKVVPAELEDIDFARCGERSAA